MNKDYLLDKTIIIDTMQQLHNHITVVCSHCHNTLEPVHNENQDGTISLSVSCDRCETRIFSSGFNNGRWEDDDGY
jgi:predicted metal-binding protein